jgi:hypothetical protein
MFWIFINVLQMCFKYVDTLLIFRLQDLLFEDPKKLLYFYSFFF